MTDPIESAVKADAQKFIAKQEGWLRTNLKPLLIGAAILLVVEVLLIGAIRLL